MNYTQSSYMYKIWDKVKGEYVGKKTSPKYLFNPKALTRFLHDRKKSEIENYAIGVYKLNIVETIPASDFLEKKTIDNEKVISFKEKQVLKSIVNKQPIDVRRVKKYLKLLEKRKMIIIGCSLDNHGYVQATERGLHFNRKWGL